MLELVVAAFEDGWAFVRDGERYLLVRPPYRRDDLAEVTRSTITRALGIPGFEAVGSEFHDWVTLIEFLQEKLIAEAPVDLPAAGSASIGLLEYAPREILVRYLDRVERELLPSRRWSAACNLLLSMLDLDVVRSDGDLHRRATDLLRRATEGGITQTARRRELSFDEAVVGQRFSCAVRAHGAAAMFELVKSVAMRGQLLRPVT